MADISSVQLPDGNNYNLKDSSARSSLSNAGTKSTLVIVEEKSVDNQTINANATVNIQLNVQKSGYTVLGLGGWSMHNATTNGANASWCQPYKVYFSSVNAAMSVKNWANDTAKIRCRFWVIYHKN